MQPLHTTPETDPAIQALDSIREENEQENQRRLDILRLVEEKRVPTYEQLVEASQWASSLLESGTFKEGKLEEEPGLVPISREYLDQVQSYFTADNWKLTKRELSLCHQVVDNYSPRMTDKIATVAKGAPSLAASISSDLAGLEPKERSQRIKAMNNDMVALIKLDKQIKYAQQLDPSYTGDALVESGLLGINLDKAIIALRKAVENNIPSDKEAESGLTNVQKNALLSHFGYLQTEGEESPSVKENIRRGLNGTQRKPAVVKRHKIERKIRDLEAQLDSGELSGVEKGMFELRAKRLGKRIVNGTFYHKQKYGVGTTKAALQTRNHAYDPANLLNALERLKNERDSIKDGVLAEKIHSSLSRVPGETTTNTEMPKVEFFQETYDEALSDMESRFNNLLDNEIRRLPKDKRLTDAQIREAYIEAQLDTAHAESREFRWANSIVTNSPQYNQYIKNFLDAFHAYNPSAEPEPEPETQKASDTSTQKTKSNPSPSDMPKKRRETISRSSSREVTEQEKNAGSSIENLRNIIND